MGEQVRGTPDRRLLPGDQHPERYRHDLNPNPTAGQNHGPLGNSPSATTAYHVKDVHQTWRDLSDADLKQLPVIQAALAIHSVEARHAAWMRHLFGVRPAATPFDEAKPSGEILKLVRATRFIVARPRMLGKRGPTFTG